jgi:hypothetical protein
MSQTSYEQDFYAWLTEQAAHLRAKEWDAIDIDNVAEELDTLGRSERHAVGVISGCCCCTCSNGPISPNGVAGVGNAVSYWPDSISIGD